MSQTMTRIRLLAAAHLAGNALALWLGYYWLGLGESRMSLLVWSFVVGLIIAALFCWLHGSGFAFFRESDAAASAAMRSASANLPPLLAAAILLLIVYGVIAWLQTWSSGPAFRFASWLTLTLRKPVKPAAMINAFGVGWWIVRWIVTPVLFLPAISAISVRGWAGFGSLGPVRGYKLTWIETPLLLLCAFWAPLKLMAWHPITNGFGPEMFSFLVRIAVAYLFFVAGCLALEFSASRRPPKAALG